MHHVITISSALRRDPRTGASSGHGKAFMSYKGKPLGETATKEPIYEGSRRLLASGLAWPGDSVETVWADSGTPSMHAANVSVAAEMTVSEPDRGSMRVAKYVPMAERYS